MKLTKLKMISSTIFIWLSTLFLIVPITATNIVSEIEIIEQDTAGTYPVKITYIDEVTNETITKTIYMTVMYPKTVISNINGEGIDAQDIIISEKNAENMSTTDIINQAKAHAWKLEDGSEISIVSVEVEAIESNIGLYKIILSTEQGTTATIQMLKTKEQLLIADKQYTFFETFGQTFEERAFYFLITIILLPLILLIIVFILVLHKRQQLLKLLYEKSLFSKE